MSSRSPDRAALASLEGWRLLAERSGWQVPVAAKLLGISPRQLERLSQRDLGRTPSEWFHDDRMSTAARLLSAGMSVKLVADRLGYSLPANFSRDFKRHHGRTPRNFALPRLIDMAVEERMPAPPPIAPN